jgi:hypothetical protein
VAYHVTQEIMERYILKISETKTEIIEYLGYSIGDDYCFSFDDGTMYYILKE